MRESEESSAATERKSREHPEAGPVNAVRMNRKDPSGTKAARKRKQPDYTWEVSANDRDYQQSLKKTSFLCFRQQKCAGNSITTSKYNVLTFIPLNLFEQFHKGYILYFMLMIILQAIPAISTTPWYAIIIPISILLTLRALRDLFEDIARHKSDKMINNRPTEILKGNSFCQSKWKHIQVGDIVRLKKDDLVPADLLLLQSSEPNSLCYVETSGIDGETNLKFRQAPMITHDSLSSIPALAAFNGKVICESPNSKMHTFIGTLEWKGEKYPLDNDKMLLRGCRIRNTDTCYGLVIYAGIQTKIMKNSGKVTLKKTKLDLLMNKIVYSILLMLIGASICLAISAGVWQAWIQEKHHYVPALPPQITPYYYAFLLFWGFIILLNTLVPMILYLTMETIYMVHSLYINWDLEMYYAETDTPAHARTTSLNDHLGQIEYIFSDKTGTLTQNIMTFKKCCINGCVYGRRSEDADEIQEVSFCWNPYADKRFQFSDQTLVDVVRGSQEQVAKEFFRLLALCHTVMVEEKAGDLVYQAASPDEGALVTAARNFGYVFLARTQDTITLSELGEEKTYSVLALMDFDSVRKRMSILVRDPEGKIKLYTKGADDVILERVRPDSPNQESTEKTLDTFANETLRILCLACKNVEESVYIQWSKKHKEASVTLQNRAKELATVYEEIERDLELLGATAIEDKLQDGVPETIDLLRRGNMKVWMLTGDKQETAVNIGFACRLLRDDMEILSESEACDMLDASVKHFSSCGKDGLADDAGGKEKAIHHRTALVITGEFLTKILSPDDNKTKKRSFTRRLAAFWFPKKMRRKEIEENPRESAFVDLASRCQTVICCRVTPKQKAMIVQLVKRHTNAPTLAIGDGGNDVNMIKTADIGVGISGQEGLQAVIASDFALAQFRFLQRLLLVHGRWSYLRICKFLRFYFYKTFAVVLGNIWFACFNAFSAQIIFDPWILAFYHLFYTSFTCFTLGILDKDMSAKMSLLSPELYRVGQTDSLFNYRVFLQSILYGAYTSLVGFFITLGAFKDTAGPEGICDYQAFSMTFTTSIFLAATTEVTMEYSQWNVVTVLAVILSLLFYFPITFLTQLSSANPVMFTFRDVNRNTFSKLFIWLVIFLAVAVSILPSLIGRFVARISSSKVTCREDDPNMEIAMEDHAVQLESYLKKDDWLRRASNAFSHNEGYADLITRGASFRKKRPASLPPVEDIAPCQEDKNPHV